MIFAKDLRCSRNNIWLKIRLISIETNRIYNTAITVILILFHPGGFKCFRHYYKEYACKHLTQPFPHRIPYNRFAEKLLLLLQRTVS